MEINGEELVKKLCDIFSHKKIVKYASEDLLSIVNKIDDMHNLIQVNWEVLEVLKSYFELQNDICFVNNYNLACDTFKHYYSADARRYIFIYFDKLKLYVITNIIHLSGIPTEALIHNGMQIIVPHDIVHRLIIPIKINLFDIKRHIVNYFANKHEIINVNDIIFINNYNNGIFIIPRYICSLDEEILFTSKIIRYINLNGGEDYSHNIIEQKKYSENANIYPVQGYTSDIRNIRFLY